jgi:ABC-type multidrug transport system fused ATPase/permease subunit
MVGERGSTLSGGQRQRIAIARAVIRDAPVLLLDEAMSSLDSVAERKVNSALKELTAGRTTFVASHRLWTIVDADMIVVLKDGHTEGVGQHMDLLETCEAYRKLWDAQRHHDSAAAAANSMAPAEGRGSGEARV